MNVPKGWKLVPIQPTEKMRVAGDAAGQFEDDYPRDSRRAAEVVYEAMLAVAPKPPP